MLFFKKKERRAEGEVQFENNLLTALIGGGSAASRNSALEIPAVQSCVELLAGIVSSLPLKLYEETDGKVTEIKDDIRTKLFNGDTGDVLNGTELRKQWVRDYFLGKGAYTYIDRDIYGMPRGLYYVSESRISIIPNNEAIFKDYTVLVEGKAYPKSDFLKILRNSRGDGRGISIIEENTVILLTAYNTMRFENSVVKKGGNKRGFLTSQRQQTKDSMKAVKEAWRKMFSNSLDVEDNICVLNEGMDFKEASATALEMQLNENKNTNSAEICKLFGVPPEIFSGNASEQVRENFISNSIAPLLNVFEAALDSDLLLEKEKGRRYFAFDTRELTRGNILQRYNAYSVGLQSGFLQFDDVRELEDLEPLNFPYIKLGLNDVLYNPATKEVYTPNTNAFVDLGKAGVPLESGIAEDIRGTEELRFNPYHDPINGRFTTASGANSRLNAAIHIAKNSVESGHYYKSQSENGIFITDGFRIHKHKSIEGDKVLPKSGRKQKSVNAETLYNGIKSEFTEAEKTGALKEIELPDISSVKNVKNSIMYDFGENAPMLNRKYLEDAIKAVPNAKAYINTSNDGTLSAVYLKNDSGDEAFVMPARKRKRPEWVPTIASTAELRYNHNHDPETGRFSSRNSEPFAKNFSNTKVFSNGGAKGVDKSEKSDIIKPSDDESYISASGPNEFKKGFDAYNLADHWYGSEKTHSHKGEYPGMTMEQYAERALTLVQMPTSKNILGYKDNHGNVIRYDKVENDFVKGNPQKGIKTMFKPNNGEDYYNNQKKIDMED